MKAELVNNDNDTSSKMSEEPPTQEEEAIIEDTIIMGGLSPIVADNNGINEIFLQLRKDDVTEDSSFNTKMLEMEKAVQVNQQLTFITF